ncbi:unnamed protein product [Pieris brassicae]|uniref:Uncharacterized protein n=1 Tax=Pieris brassicae TaxID=7116 RepID=A0A9P0TKJ9_PIEBR|nr:unnamed protein product [Pieris brassicae]
MYSASVEDSTTIGCLLDAHNIGPSAIISTELEVILRVNGSPAQSESLPDTVYEPSPCSGRPQRDVRPPTWTKDN